MEIELQCECGARLAIPAEAAGKEVECPKCGQRQKVEAPRTTKPAPDAAPSETAAAPSPEPAAPAPPPPAEWFLKVPEGLIYGPVNAIELNDWVSAGRVSPDCQLRGAAASEWANATVYYPILQLPPPRRPTLAKPTPVRYSTGKGAPVLAPPPQFDAPRPIDPPALRLLPHRGLVILICSVLGWITCPLLAFAAWNMSAHDLAEMRDKRMDPDGYWQTQAAYYVSFASLVVYGVLLVVGLLVAVATWIMMGTR